MTQPQQTDPTIARRMARLKVALELVMLDEPYRAAQLSRCRYIVNEEIPNIEVKLEEGIVMVNPSWLDRQKPDPLSKALLTGVAVEEPEAVMDALKLEDIEDPGAREFMERMRGMVEETDNSSIEQARERNRKRKRGGR